jgi:hypothetical protein
MGWRRRRWDLASAALIALVLCLTLGAVAAHTPVTPVLASTVAYTLWWGSQCGMWVWLIFAWAGWLGVSRVARALVAHRARRLPAARRDRGAARRGPRHAAAVASVGASVVGLAAAGIAGGEAAAAGKPDQHVALYRPLGAIAARLDRAVPAGRTVRLDGTLDGRTQPFKPAVRYVLVRHGDRVLSRGAAPRDGDWYELDHRRYDTIVALTDRPKPPGRRLSLLVHVGFTELGVRHAVFVWTSAGAAPRA